MQSRTRADIHEDGVGSVDVLVREGRLVVAVPQREGDPVALQLQARRAGALAQAKQCSVRGHAGGNLNVLVLQVPSQP